MKQNLQQKYYSFASYININKYTDFAAPLVKIRVKKYPMYDLGGSALLMRGRSQHG
jgi:hypothetical protein